MFFNSFEFVVFFLVVYGLYLGLRHRGQNVLLLVASYFFYGWWDWRFLSLILFSTVVDYIVGLKLQASEDPGRRKRLVTVSMVVNLGLLGVFKYFGFFANSLVAGLNELGFQPDWRFAEIVLPVGISFYTFQTMSYTLDIYRGTLKPTRDFLDFAVFVAFFPQLVAGPIERASHLLPQVARARDITYGMVREGLWLVLLGFFKKVVVADNMAVFAGQVFDDPEGAHGLQVLGGIYAFAFQIYGDFSGYTDIARGISKLMGFDIMLNFRMPYFATNPSDFWRRWHISLSTWLRDYLYIPLGGNRGGPRKEYRNLMTTMVLGGLWHGAAWHFVAWGVFHGLILCIHRPLGAWFERVTKSLPLPSALVHTLCVVFFFHVTCVGWLLFAVNDLRDVPLLLANMIDPFAINFEIAVASILFFATPLMLLDWFQERSGDMNVVKSWPRALRLGVYSVLWAYILLCGVPGGEQFIYFQF